MAKITIEISGPQGSGKTLAKDAIVKMVRDKGWKLIYSCNNSIVVEASVDQLLKDKKG